MAPMTYLPLHNRVTLAQLSAAYKIPSFSYHKKLEKQVTTRRLMLLQ